MRRRRRSAVVPACAFALLATTTGCYRLHAVDAGASTAGKEVVLELSDRGSTELAPQLGAELRAVSGRVLTFRDHEYTVGVTQTRNRSGLETIWRNEAVSIRSEHVRSVSERRLDKRRSWLVAGLSVLGVVGLAEAFGVDSGLDGLLGGRGGSRQ